MANEEIRKRFTPEEYANFLAFGSDDEGSPIPGEFIHDYDHKIWFTSGGSQCVGCAFCNWHIGMDEIYAVGSRIIANIGISKKALQKAVDLLNRSESDDFYDEVERLWLIKLSNAAIKSNSSDGPQSVY